MPDGSIVSEQEVVLFCPGIETVADDTPEAILLPMVEASVKSFLKRDLTATDYVQDIDLRDELTWHDVLIKSRNTFLTEDYPVNTWAILNKVISRSKVTGLPDQLQEIPRDTYFVRLSSGVVRLLRPLQDIELRPQFSFPIGVAAMQASYNAGFTLSDIPAEIKLAVLMRFKRFHSLMKAGAWNLKMITNPQGGETTYFRADFTPEEKGLLEMHVRHALLMT